MAWKLAIMLLQAEIASSYIFRNSFDASFFDAIDASLLQMVDIRHEVFTADSPTGVVFEIIETHVA